MGAPYIYDISRLRVKLSTFLLQGNLINSSPVPFSSQHDSLDTPRLRQAFWAGLYTVEAAGEV